MEYSAFMGFFLVQGLCLNLALLVNVEKRQLIKIEPEGPILECLFHSDACAFLFYPGTMLEPGHYAAFLNFLHEFGFSVFALHLAGHGESRKACPGTFSHMLEQGIAAQNWILANASSTLVVSGHSQGGICALGHTGISAVPAAAFAFHACLPHLESAINVTRFAPFSAYRRQILHLMKRLSETFPTLPIPLPFYLSWRKILANCRRPILTGRGKSRFSYPLSFLYSLFSHELPLQIHCPMWLISSSDDALMEPNLMLESFNALSAPQKFFLQLPGGGHLALLNPGLARYSAAVCACAALSLGLCLNQADKSSADS